MSTPADDPRERVTLIPSEDPHDTEPPPTVPEDPEAVAVLLRKVLEEASGARQAAERAVNAALEALAELRRLPCRAPTESPRCPLAGHQQPGNGHDHETAAALTT